MAGKRRNQGKVCPLFSSTGVVVYSACIEDECGWWSTGWKRCGIACIDADRIEYKVVQTPADFNVCISREE